MRVPLGSFSSARLPIDFTWSSLTADNYATVYSSPLTYRVMGNTFIFVGGALAIGLSISEIGIVRSCHSIANTITRPFSGGFIQRIGHAREGRRVLRRQLRQLRGVIAEKFRGVCRAAMKMKIAGGLDRYASINVRNLAPQHAGIEVHGAGD